MTTPLDIAVENIWAAPIDFSSPYQPLDLRSWLDRLSDELRHPLPNEKDEGRSRKLIKEWVEERIRVRDGTMHPHVGVPPNLYKLQDSTSLLDDLLEMALGDTDEWPEDWAGQLPSKAIAIRYFLSRWKGEVRAYSLEREVRFRGLSHIIEVYENLITRGELCLNELSFGRVDFGIVVQTPYTTRPIRAESREPTVSSLPTVDRDLVISHQVPVPGRTPIPEICQLIKDVALDRRNELMREVRLCDETIGEMDTHMLDLRSNPTVFPNLSAEDDEEVERTRPMRITEDENPPTMAELLSAIPDNSLPYVYLTDSESGESSPPSVDSTEDHAGEQDETQHDDHLDRPIKMGQHTTVLSRMFAQHIEERANVARMSVFSSQRSGTAATDMPIVPS